jgi:NAD(P)-dependent dehydrogenase (short-subunit alcohol dehydrogenase family)
MERLDGRAAVVTGAASGIGFAITEALARAAARVLMTDIDGGALADATARVTAGGGEVDAVELDVRGADAVDRAAGAAVERFGGLHIAANNARIVNGGKSWELGLDEWHRVIDVNLWGVIHLPRCAGRRVRRCVQRCRLRLLTQCGSTSRTG